MIDGVLLLRRERREEKRISLAVNRCSTALIHRDISEHVCVCANNTLSLQGERESNRTNISCKRK